MAVQPLDGLGVVDLSRTVAGMYCSRLLAQYGAHVVRPELPLAETEPDRSPTANAYLAVVREALNVGKERRTADPGQALPSAVAALLRSARLVVTDLSTGVLTELGLEYEDLRRSRADLIYVRITPLGAQHDAGVTDVPDIVTEALSGLMALTGLPGRSPLKLGARHGQVVTGAYAALAGLSACFDNASIEIDVSIQHALAVFTFAQINDYTNRGAVSPRPVVSTGTLTLFRTQNGFVLGPISPLHGTTADDIAAFLSALPGPAVNPEDLGDANRIEATAAAKFRESDSMAIVELAQAFRLAYSPVQSIDTLAQCPQLAAYESTSTMAGGGSLSNSRPFDVEMLDEGLLGNESPSSDAPATLSPQNPPAPFRPLSGVRVLALEQIYAGPIATHLLASLGADVVKIESENRPDFYPPTRGQHGRYNEINRGKRAISLNLKTARGREIFLDLVRQSDIVLENFSRRVMPQLGLDFETISRANPRAIMLSCTGFGHRGPWADFKAYGPNVEFASGLAFLTGYADGYPIRPGGSAYGDGMAGLFGALAAVVALLQRRSVGRGAFVDLSYYRVLVTSLLHEVHAASVLGGSLLASTYQHNGDFNNQPQGCYRCLGEDDWFVLAITSDQEWGRLVDALGGELLEWRHASRLERDALRPEIDAAIAAWAAGQPRDEAVRYLEGIGVSVAPVLEPFETLFDPVLKARGAFEWIDYSPRGWHEIRPHLRPPWRFSGRAAYQAPPAPSQLGEDNQAVLWEYLGYSPELVESLREQGVMGTRLGDHVVRPPVPGPGAREDGGPSKWADPDFRAHVGLRDSAR